MKVKYKIPVKKEKEVKPKLKKATKMKKLFKKMNGTSNLEITFEQILIEMDVKYVHHYRFGNREFDFFLPDFMLLLEIHGDFYHCNPELKTEVKYPFQKKSIKNDKYKVKLVEKSLDYNLIVFWENDINKHKDKVVNQLIAEITRLEK